MAARGGEEDELSTLCEMCEEERGALASDLIDGMPPDHIAKALNLALVAPLLPARLAAGIGMSDDPLAPLLPFLSSKQAGPRRCGYIFNEGDISWHCRTCQADDTCVLCQDCFNASPKHRDHDVFFSRTAGGCCDCGDPEAWRSECDCAIHAGRTSGEEHEGMRTHAEEGHVGGEASEDPGSPLPASMIASLRAVSSAALYAVLRGAEFSRSRSEWNNTMTDIIAFGDAAAEVAQISADAAASASSAFAHSRHLSAKAARLRADKWSLDSSFALWVLADDWHSVEEMAAALQRVDLSHDKATTAAREAIASGIARVQEGPLTSLAHAFTLLRTSGFLVSISVPEDSTPGSLARAAAAARWLATTASRSSALAEQIVDALLSPPPTIPNEALYAGQSAVQTDLDVARSESAAHAYATKRGSATWCEIQTGLRAYSPIDRCFRIARTPGVFEAAPQAERRAVLLARAVLSEETVAATPEGGAAASARGATDGTGIEGDPRQTPVGQGGRRAQSGLAHESEAERTVPSPTNLLKIALSAADSTSWPGAPEQGRAAERGQVSPGDFTTSLKAAMRIGPLGNARVDEMSGWADLERKQAREAALASGMGVVMLPPSTPAEMARGLRQPLSSTANAPATSAAKLRVLLPRDHRAAGTRFAWHLPCRCAGHVVRFSTTMHGCRTALVSWDTSTCEVKLPGLLESTPSGGALDSEVIMPGQGGKHIGGTGVGKDSDNADKAGSRCSPTVLCWLMEADATLPRVLTTELHRLYLACLGVPAFRLAFAKTFSYMYLPLALRYTAGIGTKSEALLGLSTQVYTAPSLILHAGPTSSLTSALLSLDRVLHNASDLEVVEVLAGYTPTLAADLLSRALKTTADGRQNEGATSEHPWPEGVTPPLAAPRSFPVTPPTGRAPLQSGHLMTPGAAGSPAEWSPLCPRSGIGEAWRSEAEGGYDPLSGEPAPGCEPAPLPKLKFDDKGLKSRRYDVMARDLDYILHSLATASADAPAFCDSGTGTGASWETLASIPCRSTEWLTAHPFAPPQGASLFLRWLRILERIQGADPKVRSTLTHVEHEQRKWLQAFDLALTVGSIFRSALVASGVDADEMTASFRTSHGTSGDSTATATHASRVVAAQAETTRAVATATLDSVFRWVRHDLPASRRYVRLPAPCPPLATRVLASSRKAVRAGSLAESPSESICGATSPGSSAVPKDKEIENGDSTEAIQSEPPTVLLIDGDICTRKEGTSFHLPLHRFFAAVLREAAAMPLPPIQASSDSQQDLVSGSQQVALFSSLLDEIVSQVSAWPPPADDVHWEGAVAQRERLRREAKAFGISYPVVAPPPTRAMASDKHIQQTGLARDRLGSSEDRGAAVSASSTPCSVATPSASPFAHCSEAATETRCHQADLADTPTPRSDEDGTSDDNDAAHGDGILGGTTIDSECAGLGQGIEEWRGRRRALGAVETLGENPSHDSTVGAAPSRPPPSTPIPRRKRRVEPPCGPPPPWPAKQSNEETRRLLLLQLAEHPIRVLALSAQVGAHLWRRNGAEMLSQVLYYSVPPQCMRLRDLDLLLIQYVAASFTPTPTDLLLTLLHRFRLYGWALRACAPSEATAAATAARVSNAFSDEVRALALAHLEAIVHCDDAQRLRLVAEVLQLIIQIASALPPPPPPPPEATGVAAKASSPRPIMSPTTTALWYRDPPRAVLRRELIHLLAQSPATRSEASKVLELIPRPSDARRMTDVFDEILLEVATRDTTPGVGNNVGASFTTGGLMDGGGRRSAPQWRLREELWAEIDPEHNHTALHFLRVAAGVVGGGGGVLPAAGPNGGQPSGKQLSSSPPSKLPLAAAFAWGTPFVAPPPPAHPFFLRARRILHEPVLVCLLRSALATGNTDEVISRSIHLLTLAVYTLDDPIDGMESGVATCPTAAIPSGSPVAAAAVARRLRFLRSLCAEAPSSESLRLLPPTGPTAAAADALRPSLSTERPLAPARFEAAAEEEVLRAIHRMLRWPPPPPEPSPEFRQSSEAAAAAGAGEAKSSVLGILFKMANQGSNAGLGGTAIRVSELVGGDKNAFAGRGVVSESIARGCAWLLHKLASRDSTCAETINSLQQSASLVSSTSSAGATEERSAKAEEAAEVERRARKMAAKQRALAQMAKQAESFAAMITDSEAYSPATLNTTATGGKSSSLTSASAGAASSQAHTIAMPDVSEMEEETSASTEEPTVCIICHLNDADSDAPLGCIGQVQPSATLRCAREARCPEGGQTTVGSSIAASAMLRTLASNTCTRLQGTSDSSDSTAVAVATTIEDSDSESRLRDRDGAASGKRAKFSQGQPRRELHASFCGHSVHFDCFQAYAESLSQRAERDIHFEGRLAVDINRGEFLCPLCKRLSNIILPHLEIAPHHEALVRAVLLEPPRAGGIVTADASAKANSSSCKGIAACDGSFAPCNVSSRHMSIRSAIAPFLPSHDARRDWPGYALPNIPSQNGQDSIPKSTQSPQVAASVVEFSGNQPTNWLKSTLDSKLRSVMAQADILRAVTQHAASRGGSSIANAGSHCILPATCDMITRLVEGTEWVCRATQAGVVNASHVPPQAGSSEPADEVFTAAPRSIDTRCTASSANTSRAVPLASLIGCFQVASALCRIIRAQLPAANGATCLATTVALPSPAPTNRTSAILHSVVSLEWSFNDISASLPPWCTSNGIDAPTLRWLVELIPTTVVTEGIKAPAATIPWKRVPTAVLHTKALPRSSAEATAADTCVAWLESLTASLNGACEESPCLGWGAATASAWGGQPPLTPSHRRWLSHALRNLFRLSAPPPAPDQPLHVEEATGGLLGPGARLMCATPTNGSAWSEGDEGAQISAEIAAELLAQEASALVSNVGTTDHFDVSSAIGCRALLECLWRTISYTMRVETETETEVEANTESGTSVQSPGALNAAIEGTPRSAAMRPLIRAARLSPFLFPRPEDVTTAISADLSLLLTRGTCDPPPSSSVLAQAPVTSSATSDATQSGKKDAGCLSTIIAGNDAGPRPRSNSPCVSVTAIRREPIAMFTAFASPMAMVPSQSGDPDGLRMADNFDTATTPPLAPVVAGASSPLQFASSVASAPLHRYELTLSDGVSTVEAQLSPSLSWLVDAGKVRPGSSLLMHDWLAKQGHLILLHVEPCEDWRDSSSASHLPCYKSSNELPKSGISCGVPFSLPMLLWPPHLLLTAMLLHSADADVSTKIIRALALSTLARVLMLSSALVCSGDVAPSESYGLNVWTVLSAPATSQTLSAIGSGWPVFSSPTRDSPILCWLKPGSSIRAKPDSQPKSPPGWMHVCMASMDAQDALFPDDSLRHARPKFRYKEGWTRASFDEPIDCVLIRDYPTVASIPSGTESAVRSPVPSDDDITSLRRLRSALGIHSDASSPSGTALVQLLQAELCSFFRSARSLLGAISPRPEDANVAVPQSCYRGDGMLNTLLIAAGAPTVHDVLGCPRLISTMRLWVQSAQAELKPFVLAWIPTRSSGKHVTRPLAGPGTILGLPAPASLKLLSTKGSAPFCSLPVRYTDLYSSPSFRKHRCPTTGQPPAEPALCLICGALLCAGSECCKRDGLGALTRHAAAECSEGSGVFLLLHKCQTVILRGSHAAYWSSPYVDDFGEEDSGLERGRPLKLDPVRLARLRKMWSGHAVAAAVVKERSTRDRIIRDNYM